MNKYRLIIALFLLPLPSLLKRAGYRIFCRYKIEKGVKIGFSIIIAEHVFIQEKSRIGHFNFIAMMEKLDISDNVNIGHFNMLLGGQRVALGSGAVIGRFNEINSILNPINHGTAVPDLIVGRRAIITAWHKIDFTDRVELGESVVFAGRNSNIWTHNRQRVRPVEIGRNCYIGSGVQFAPGTSIGAYCVLALGSVVTKRLDTNWHIVGGVPATPIKAINDENRALVEFPTRPDLDVVGTVN